jgi:signal transduction histidine kinase
MDNLKIARFRLTGWYLLIVFLVVSIFSLLIFQDLANELNRGYRAIENSIQTQPLSPGRTMFLTRLFEELENAKQLVMVRLLVVDSFILATSGILAYFLAGKSLQPIGESIKKQKQFISDASHELKTPLTVMRSEIDVALRQKTISSKETKEILQSNLDEVVKMQNLTNYLLSLGKYEDTKRPTIKKTIDIKPLIEQVAKRHSREIKVKGLNLELKIQNAKITAEQESISELITILVDNAIKYTPTGKITISTKQGRKTVTIEVADQGIGIPPKDIDNIFNRFYRADISRSKDGTNGFGLGLSIAKSIVEAHEGEICVKSKLGKGSKFIVTLPRR